MAVGAAHGPVVEDIVNPFACMIVLITGCWIEVQVLTEGCSRVVLLILEAVERPAALLTVS